MESRLASRKNLGHVFLECMRQYPDTICQIDAATGEEETSVSVLSRSIQLAKCFRKFGLKPGDVLSLGGRNHLDLHIPYYAALLIGMPISGVDPYYKFDEIKSLLTTTRPKIAFCQQESYDYYVRALKDIGLVTKILTFDGEANNFKRFIESYNQDDVATELEPADFDTTKVFAYLVSTSGTTGGVKVAAFTHDVAMGKFNLFKSVVSSMGKNDRIVNLNLSPVQWISGMINALILPVLYQTKLQTPKPDDVDHIIEIINKYKPFCGLLSPALLATLVQRKDEVDLTYFREINVAGSKLFPELLRQLQRIIHKDARIIEAYGLTETFGPIMFPIPGTPFGSCGVVVPPNIIKLVDPESDKEITEPNVPGELLIKGPIFTEYYRDPQATAAVFTKDGFFRTGDLLYRDENDFYYYVDRIKSLIKYRNYNVLPAEIEAVILGHPSVRFVCVCGVRHREDGERPAACVEIEHGCSVTEQEIVDLVASTLSKNKHLHGGVVIVDQIPMTSSGKLARRQVLELLNKSLKC